MRRKRPQERGSRGGPASAALGVLALLGPACGPSMGAPADGAADSAPLTVPVVRLAVDADRDGLATFGESDRAFRAAWDATHGAMLLANVDDDDGDHRVDAEDDVVNGPEDARDLAPIHVDAWPDAPDDARATLAVSGPPAGRVRLFRRQAGEWAAFDPARDALGPDELRAGVELGIESRQFPSAAWDGRVEITLAVAGGGAEVGTDRVVMRVAPFVLGNPVGRTERVYISEAFSYLPSRIFVQDVERATEADGMQLVRIDASDPAYLREDAPDVWTQDFMEFGWTAIPAPGGALRAMHVVLRSPVANRPATSVAEREILGPDVGYVWPRSPRPPSAASYDPSIDSFGNLEPTPPFARGDARHPLGRVILGWTDRRHGDPALLAFLEAQRVQGPVLKVDTSWLHVGHVDEFVSFVPSNNAPRGWTMLIASPRLARALLQGLVERDPANADALMFEGQSFYVTEEGERFGQPYPAQRTIGAILADADLMAFNQRVQATLDGLRAELARELGLGDGDVREIPFLFADQELGLAGALMPGTVNLLSYGTTAVVPHSHGAVIDGVDYFDRDTTERLGALGVTARFAEEWDILHAAGGEVHCGTNALRAIPTDVRWWEVDR